MTSASSWGTETMLCVPTELRHGRDVAFLVVKKQHVWKWNSSCLVKSTPTHQQFIHIQIQYLQLNSQQIHPNITSLSSARSIYWKQRTAHGFSFRANYRVINDKQVSGVVQHEPWRFQSLPEKGFGPPINTCFLGPIWVSPPNDISISSIALAQLTQHTDTPTTLRATCVAS